jgi:hypothetical protein
MTPDLRHPAEQHQRCHGARRRASHEAMSGMPCTARRLDRVAVVATTADTATTWTTKPERPKEPRNG